MDGVEQNHPDLLYHKLDEDGDLVRASSDSRLEVQDKDEVNGLPFHVIEVRIAYLRYKQKTQERIARESNRQLWVARSQWQSKVDDLWGQYCALRYDTKDPGEQGVRGKGKIVMPGRSSLIVGEECTEIPSALLSTGSTGLKKRRRRYA